jgi:plasmid maintenance system antidote protein VapI
MGMEKLRNIHPGEILLEEILLPMKISQTRLANSIGVPQRRINLKTAVDLMCNASIVANIALQAN